MGGRGFSLIPRRTLLVGFTGKSWYQIYSNADEDRRRAVISRSGTWIHDVIMRKIAQDWGTPKRATRKVLVMTDSNK